MKTFLSIILFFTSLITLHDAEAQINPQSIELDSAVTHDEENLNALQQWIRWNDPGSFLIHHVNSLAYDLYEKRDRTIRDIKTREDWLKRQADVKEILMNTVGPFPEKTPLNPRITGTIKKDGYRIEKIIFEAFPHYYVPGCIYIPDHIKGKAPAVLNVIGHNQEAYKNELYQVINTNLAIKGIIVFAIDPPGQDEHLQYFDQSIGFSSVGYTVIEHSYFGNQCFLSGQSCAKYFIWEGIRAIDYLISRKDVDPERIGVTGWSGGGTVTTYLGAFDDRVKVTVPCSWATSSRRQLESKGAQDAECEFYEGLKKGITLEDLLEVRAPKPTLMTFTSRDEYLDLQGARDAYEEVKNAYEALGVPANLQMVEDDSKHWMTLKIRHAIYSFFMKHFNLPVDSEEKAVEILSEKEMMVTPTGQVSTYLGGNMIFDENKLIAARQIEDLEDARENVERHLKEVKLKAVDISGYIAPDAADLTYFINGRYPREGYTVSKFAVGGEGNYVIPLLLFVPNDVSKKYPAIIYLHPKGKIAEAGVGGEIERLVRRGFVVAAADLPGVGEAANTAVRGDAPAYTAILTGRSIPGIQAGDISRVADFLKTRQEVDALAISGIGINEMCIPLVHAAAFDRSIKNVVLKGMLISYRSVAMKRLFMIGRTARENGGTHHPYEVDFDWGVAGALTAYDLPDLIGCIAPGKVALIGLKDPMLDPAEDSLVNLEMKFPGMAYSTSKSSQNLLIMPGGKSISELAEWCFR